MIRKALFMLLGSLSLALCAQTPAERAFNSADMKLLAEANLDYTSCLQVRAQEQLGSSPDIRVVAAKAAEICESVLTDLHAALVENGVNPDFYRGAVTRIKNRAIRRLLPLMMMEKSQSEGG